MSAVMYSEFIVKLESIISDMVITMTEVRAGDDVDAGEVAKSFMATPHHWRVVATQEQ